MGITSDGLSFWQAETEGIDLLDTRERNAGYDTCHIAIMTRFVTRLPSQWDSSSSMLSAERCGIHHAVQKRRYILQGGFLLCHLAPYIV